MKSVVLVQAFEAAPVGQTKRETFDLKRKELNSALDARYYSLTKEIAQIEITRLWQFWK
jgi:hypothetical protein